MALLTATEARNQFTKQLAATFSDRLKPKTFFRSFFKETETAAKNISIEVMRDAQTIAVDVIAGTDGNRNTWETSTEKIFTPPNYNEYFDATQLEAYEALYTNDGDVPAIAFGKFLYAAAAKMEGLFDKIDRAYELQTAQALTDGIVQLKNGFNIDFKRKAASLIAYGVGNDWSINTVDPNTIILQGATFIKEVGKSEGAVLNMIMGNLVYPAYLGNAKVQARALAQQYGLDAIAMPQRNSVGASFHGEIGVGAYRVRLWTYPEVYKHPVTGVSTAYMHPKKIIIVPEVTNNVLSYAGVPQLLSTGIAPKKGKFVTYEHLDDLTVSHRMGVKSAGIAIPVAVDQCFTAQVLS